MTTPSVSPVGKARYWFEFDFKFTLLRSERFRPEQFELCLVEIFRKSERHNNDDAFLLCASLHLEKYAACVEHDCRRSHLNQSGPKETKVKTLDRARFEINI